MEKRGFQRLFSFGNRIIFYLSLLFLVLTLYFALTSANLVIGDNSFFGTSTTGVSTFFVLSFLAIVIALAVFPSVQRVGVFLFSKHRYTTSITSFVLVVILQIMLVHYVHPPIGWDVGAIHDGLTDPGNKELQAYFSLNYNNVPLLLLQHKLAVLFSNTSWQFFDTVTLFLVDLSAVLNILSIAILDKKKVPIAIYLHSLWLVLFPSIIVPYTDTWVLPFVSLFIFCYCVIAHSKAGIFFRGLAMVLFGFSAVGAYFIKPSAMIGIIAIVLIELLFVFKKRDTETFKSTKFVSILFLAISLISAGISYTGISKQLDTQSYIKVDKKREIPAVHFISIGMTDEGGYNTKEALAMASLPTKQEKIHYSLDRINDHLKEKGFGGYLAFLVKKQANNTADGTFGWLKEGNFIKENQSPSKKSTADKIKNFLYLYGENIADFRFISQTMWVLFLGLLVFGWQDKKKITQMLRLAILGGFVFLLIFEGGRSRYLIQFLPYFLLLAALICGTAVSQIKQLLKWLF